jgi:uncharacterized protein (TIGR03905 family)
MGTRSFQYDIHNGDICAKQILFKTLNNKVHNVTFIGGCSGNLKALAKLVEGMDINEVISKLENIRCGTKSSSCAHQFTLALREAMRDE